MSLATRLALTYLLITLVGLLLVGGGFVALAGRYLAHERERELGAQAEIYAAFLGELAATPAQLQALTQSLPGGELLPAGAAARIFSPAGALVAGDPALGPFPSRAALALTRPTFPLPASQVPERLYAARQIAGAGGPIGVVELSRDTGADSRLLRALAGLVLQAALVTALLVAALSALVARGIARPVVRLTRRATQLAAACAPRGPLAVDGLVEAAPAPRGLARALGGADEIAALERSLEGLDRGLRAYLDRIGELEQARMSFYRGVSHDLRTPLMAISGALENLADRAPADQRATLLTLEQETARLSRLVDELLRPPDDGRLALLTRAPVDLRALASEVVALLAGRARRAGVELQLVHGGGDPEGSAALVVTGDRDRLKQALLNLLDNALRVTPAGGMVLLRAEAAGAQARLVVEDEGPGVEPALRARIWERGVRGDDPSAVGSAGLGLAIVREVAVAHGGRAYLDGAWGPGARFVLELPV